MLSSLYCAGCRALVPIASMREGSDGAYRCVTCDATYLEPETGYERFRAGQPVNDNLPYRITCPI